MAAKPNNTDPANGNISAPITNTKFIHRQTEYQVFPEEFFSGSDVTVYFGDLFVDTITGIEFTLQEQLRPIFGYADYTYSDISRGQRIVQGTFRIAFKQSGYLFTILEHIAELGDKARPTLAYLETNQDVPDWHASARQTIEDLLDYYYNDSGETADVYTTVDSSEVDYLDWPEMALWNSDQDERSQASQSAKKAGFDGSVAHLQSMLIAAGYTIPDANTDSIVGLKQRYIDGDKWPTYDGSGKTTFAYHIGSDWYNTITWGVNGDWDVSGRPSMPLDGRDYYSDADALLEKRLYYYTFLQDQQIRMADKGDGTGVDGKFGDLVRHGVALFQLFAEHVPGEIPDTELEFIEYVNPITGDNDNGWAGWVDEKTAAYLATGLTEPNGVYNVATKAAVYNFQRDHGLEPTGVCDGNTIIKISETYNQIKVSNKVKTGTEALSNGGTSANPARGFDARIAAYESEIWGRQDSGDNDHNRRTFFYDGGFVSSGEEPQLPKLKKTGFDIMITYGPIGIWALQNVNANNPTTYNGSLDPVGGPTKTAPFSNTVHSIRAVQLASVGQVINADGTPIEEIYAFMAKDID